MSKRKENINGYVNTYEILKSYDYDCDWMKVLNGYYEKYNLSPSNKLIVYSLVLRPLYDAFIKLDKEGIVDLYKNGTDIITFTYGCFTFRSGVAIGARSVKELKEKIDSKLSKRGYNITNIPITITQEVKRIYEKNTKSSRVNKRLSIKAYNALRELDYGGLLGYNPKWRNELLTNIKSYDITSSYPYIIQSYGMPQTDFQEVKSFEGLKGYATLGKYRFVNLRLKSHIVIGMRKISNQFLGELWDVTEEYKILHTPKTIEIWALNIDLQAIRELYEYDSIELLPLYGLFAAKLGKAPKGVLDTMKMFFDIKQEHKGDQVAKVGLNLLYGIYATDPLKHKENKDQKTLDEVYNSKPSFALYSVGAYICAVARLRLVLFLDAIGANVVYVDTDSVKFVGEFDGLFESVNDYCGLKEGDMGYWKFEGKYDEFITTGFKQYSYMEDGKFEIKCSGLSNRSECKNIKQFKIGFIFQHGRGKNSPYTLGGMNDEQLL